MSALDTVVKSGAFAAFDFNRQQLMDSDRMCEPMYGQENGGMLFRGSEFDLVSPDTISYLAGQCVSPDVSNGKPVIRKSTPTDKVVYPINRGTDWNDAMATISIMDGSAPIVTNVVPTKDAQGADRAVVFGDKLICVAGDLRIAVLPADIAAAQFVVEIVNYVDRAGLVTAWEKSHTAPTAYAKMVIKQNPIIA